MFHNTHSYIASELYHTDNDLFLVGSILPDLAVTGIIAWEGGLHGKESDISFGRFIVDRDESLIDLAKGIHAHNIIDFFTHTDYRGGVGYAFRNNQRLAEQVARYYNLSEERSIGTAHNFIEIGVDILLLREKLSVQNKLKEAIEALDRERVTKTLSDYFRADQSNFSEKLSLFLELFSRYNFRVVRNWVLFWHDLEPMLNLSDIGNKRRTELINLALNITRDSYSDFLTYAISEGAKLK